MGNSALKLIHSRRKSRHSPFVREVQLASRDFLSKGHSLQAIYHTPLDFPPSIAQKVIQDFTDSGDTVCDPLARNGVVGLEAILLGRDVVLSEINRVFQLFSRCKISPVYLDDIVLALQFLNLSLPIDAGLHTRDFEPFYDINTFREIINLKKWQRQVTVRENVSLFIKALAMSLLHGPNANYFSVYTYSHLSLTPQQQRELNLRRQQSPDYRALSPRLIKHAASLLSDGITQSMYSSAKRSYLVNNHPLNLKDLPSNFADLVLTALPMPGESLINVNDLWLKSWFEGDRDHKGLFSFYKFEDWLSFINSYMFEMLTIVKDGKFIALYLPWNSCYNFEKAVVKLEQMIEESFSRFIDFIGRYDVILFKNTALPKEYSHTPTKRFIGRCLIYQRLV